jgi:hypothetical protein
LLRALSRVGERKSTGIARVMATYFGARDEFEPVSRDELLDHLRRGAVNLLDMCPEDKLAIPCQPHIDDIPKSRITIGPPPREAVIRSPAIGWPR